MRERGRDGADRAGPALDPPHLHLPPGRAGDGPDDLQCRPRGNGDDTCVGDELWRELPPVLHPHGAAGDPEHRRQTPHEAGPHEQAVLVVPAVERDNVVVPLYSAVSLGEPADAAPEGGDRRGQYIDRPVDGRPGVLDDDPDAVGVGEAGRGIGRHSAAFLKVPVAAIGEAAGGDIAKVRMKSRATVPDRHYPGGRGAGSESGSSGKSASK